MSGCSKELFKMSNTLKSIIVKPIFLRMKGNNLILKLMFCIVEYYMFLEAFKSACH